MLNLIKLEWQKHRLAHYFKGYLLCLISIYSFVVLISLGTKDDVDDVMSSFQEFMSPVYIFSNITFIIFGSVLLSRLIISEFRMNTMQVLFTYPIHRKRILFAKLMLTFLLTAGSLFTSIWIMQILTYFLQPSLELFEGTVTVQNLIATLPQTITNALMMGAIALIPLFFGMRKKSTPATITSAIIIAFLINSTVSNGSESFSLMDVLFVPLILALLGVGIAYSSFRNINKKDME